MFIKSIKLTPKGASIVFTDQEAFSDDEVLNSSATLKGDWLLHKDFTKAMDGFRAFLPFMLDIPKTKSSHCTVKAVSITMDDDTDEYGIVVSGSRTLKDGRCLNFNTPFTAEKHIKGTREREMFVKLIDDIQDEGVLYVEDRKRTISQIEIPFVEGDSDEGYFDQDKPLAVVHTQQARTA